MNASKMKILFPLLSLLIVLSSCVTDHAERVYIPLPPSNSPVAVLNAIPPTPFEVVADIQWEGGSMQKMASRAAQLGGDAVIIQLLGGGVDFRNRSPEEMNKNAKTFNRMAGTVIRYKK
jgi:hypothetical protein